MLHDFVKDLNISGDTTVIYDEKYRKLVWQLGV